MFDRIRFWLNRLGERLWVKPLFVCLVSIFAVYLARLSDDLNMAQLVPDISADSIQTLLSIMSSSMLVIATFAVGSMLSAYNAAGNTATPRSFSLVISDDVSQNALSTFVGAFIFSIVALIALTNGYFDKAGRFAIFLFTLINLVMVVLTFVRWVDRIARLGRRGSTIGKVEAATAAAMQHRRLAPNLHGVPVRGDPTTGTPVFSDLIGYVQRVDVPALQAYAEQQQVIIVLQAQPGSLAMPGRALAYVRGGQTGQDSELDPEPITSAFIIGKERRFDDDPRFGLVVLSEIASTALSPAVNDPGTAIGVITTLVRLLADWNEPIGENELEVPSCDRVEVALLNPDDLFDDAFGAIARDGAAQIEVAGRLQQALQALAVGGMRQAAFAQSRRALLYAEAALQVTPDLERLRDLAAFSETGPGSSDYQNWPAPD